MQDENACRATRPYHCAWRRPAHCMHASRRDAAHQQSPARPDGTLRDHLVPRVLASALLAGRQRKEDAYDGRSQQKRPRDLPVAVSRCELCVRPGACARVAGHRAMRFWRCSCGRLRAVEVVAARAVHEKTRARRRRRAMWRRARRGSFWLGQSSSDDRRRHRALRGAVRRHVQSAVEATLSARRRPILCCVRSGSSAAPWRSAACRSLQLARGDGRRDASGAVDGPRRCHRARRRRDRRLVQLLDRARAFRRIARFCSHRNDFGHTWQRRRRRDPGPRAARPVAALGAVAVHRRAFAALASRAAGVDAVRRRNRSLRSRRSSTTRTKSVV